MKCKKLVLTIILILSTQAYAQESLQTDAAKLSYSAGVYSVRGIKPLIDSQADFDKVKFLEGVNSVLDGDKTLITEDEMREVLMAAEEKRANKVKEQQAKQGEENKLKGAEFIAMYSKKENIQKTDSGLLYKVIETGDGESPVKENTVVVHYTGRLIDGTEFDSSVKRNQPAEFPLANVIPGWTEIVQLMKPGAKYEVVIPPELAYGDKGAGNLIGPGSTLVFDIELIEIK